MKIDLELPDWVVEEGRHLYITAGIELVAYKYLNEPWRVKTGRCNMCGKCCEGLGEVTDNCKVTNGKCNYLVMDGDKRVCALGSGRPWSCSVGVRLKNIPDCTEEFKEV